MLEHTLYVPVLRGKAGEYWALANLMNEDRQRVTPLLEIVNKTFAQPENVNKKGEASSGKTKGKKARLTSDQVIREKIVDVLVDNWGEQPIFVDLTDVKQDMFQGVDGEHLVSAFAREAALQKLITIPVTKLDQSDNFQLAIQDVCATYPYGVCIRLKPNDFASGDCSQELTQLVSALKLTPAQVDLVIDHEYVSEKAPSISEYCNKLPALDEWRTLIWTTGAFPKDLSQWRQPGQYEQTRTDWLGWRDQVTSGRLPRIPIYSDYTTQHGKYSEPVGEPRPSASLRYTSDEHWVIMRGQGTNAKNSTGWDQYPFQAFMLCKRTEFVGGDYCEGDKYIESMSQHASTAGKPAQTGSPATWLRVTINHHMTFVVRQIANLYESAIDGRSQP